MNDFRKLSRGCLTGIGNTFLPYLLLYSPLLAADMCVCVCVTYSMITYPNYKFIFTVKALGMFASKYGDSKL